MSVRELRRQPISSKETKQTVALAENPRNAVADFGPDPEMKLIPNNSHNIWEEK
jgi:hypothetical protein